MSANGALLKRLHRQRTHPGDPTNGPVWSPDGKYIAFDSLHPNAIPSILYGLSVIDAHGGNLHVLVDSGGEAPKWQLYRRREPVRVVRSI